MGLCPATDGSVDLAETHSASVQTVGHRRFSWRPVIATVLSRIDRLQRCRAVRNLSYELEAAYHPTHSICQTSHSPAAAAAPIVHWRARLLRRPSCPPPLLLP